jgi:hypothetical protein
MVDKKLISETDVQILNHNPSSPTSVPYKDTGLQAYDIMFVRSWLTTPFFNQLMHFHENIMLLEIIPRM